ncbi:cytochrome b/b6 domain-containing protein [Labrys okinawensis]|uniref:cytochrome b/b6 domain-containing protein n=1 Tax=Labrys okinawensis TaxID=346911 RepID=UPI0039BCEBC3
MAAPAIHPLLVRITHWTNAVTVMVMIASGWQIYNASPILPFRFPEALTLGGWPGGALLWHFAAMWVLALNFTVLIGYGLLSGRYSRKLWPIRPREILADVARALRGRLSHADPSHYNAVQKLLYAGVLGLIGLIMLSGLAIWKPVQLQGLTSLFGGFQGARLVHFLAMAGIAGFILIHVAMALLVPRTIRAMVTGR